MRNFVIIGTWLIVAICATPARSQTPPCAAGSVFKQSLPDPPDDGNEINDRSRPRAMEILLGRKSSAEYEKSIRLLCDETVYEYVNRITQTVARGSNVRVPVTIKIVDSTEVNALSFPGGFLYINSGLILAVENEPEIASVVAHEIAHIVARDGMRADGPLQDIGVNAGVTSSAGTSGVGEAGGYVVALNSVGARRETEADFNGIRYLQKSGYSPRALITFLEKMLVKENTDPQSVLRMLQNHPPTAERIRRIAERIGYPPANAAPVVDVELQMIQRSLLTKTTRPNGEKTDQK